LNQSGWLSRPYPPLADGVQEWRMDLRAVLAAVQSWPVEERLRLIEEVWDGLSEDGNEPELTEELKAELDRRLEALDRNPDAVVPWEVVKARALERFRK
jgi:putative addiction module component (TIGR02574 family)